MKTCGNRPTGAGCEFLDVTPKEQVATADSNHSPRFFVDESALPTGARAMAHLALDDLLAGAE